MLFVVNIDTPSNFNYCDLLVFDHQWGTANHYGTNFFRPYKIAVSQWCESVGYDYHDQSSRSQFYERVPVIYGTSLFATWALVTLARLERMFDTFPTSNDLYELGREYFPDCMPIASPVVLATILPSYVNRHNLLSWKDLILISESP